MTLTQTHLSYKFRLQQKPDGSYTAICDDPPCTLEGATREEVEQKMREKIVQQISPEIASKLTFSVPGMKVNANINFHTNLKSNTATPDASIPTVLDNSPKAEPALSPKLLVLIGALITIALLVWRLTAHS